ncbi:YncE family protein [Winogradskyella forsetii]|uniref:YncE family protein n=1 Tax=Winogradskyella forsetii TaxID=2686077 RepID=UPI0015BB1B2E|nr:YncE family protein [Winogradskyella forsetii]
MRRRKFNWYNDKMKLRNYYRQLQKDNEVTQVTITNHTEDIRKVTLWGANSQTLLADPMFLESTIAKNITVEKRPQDMVYNPANDLFYVANQLSDSVSVIDVFGTLITTISLSSSNLPGSISPVAVTVNTKTDSPKFGVIAVACSVSNEVVFIDNEIVIRRENIGKRPIDISYNIFDDCYYIANLISGTISKISNTYRVTNFLNILGARNLGMNEDNGDLYIYSVENSDISIYDSQGVLKDTIEDVTSSIVSFVYHPIKKRMYLGFSDSNIVSEIDPLTFGIVVNIRVGNNPVALAYNYNNEMLYVRNRGDQNITRLDVKNNIIDTITLGDFGVGMAISSRKDIIALSNSKNNMVNILGSQSGPTVSVNEEYYEDREDFQHNPAMVSHLKIVASGEDRINTLQLLENSVSGKEKCSTLSLSNHHSPQNFGNISEVYDISGNLIDGHVRWCFKINPKQQVTFLIYYKQFEMYKMLPEKSRISTGVQMSEGIPASWLDNNQNKLPDESNF